MKILYCAIDQTVPGTTGGSVHVAAVATGLAAFGHDVHVLAMPGAGGFPGNAVTWHAMRPPLGSRHLRLFRSAAVTRVARSMQADLILERYHNFGGEGVRAARAVGARAVLEVNAPVVDYPRSPKRRIDLALMEPMRRWRDWQCRMADLLITPAAAILPAWVPRSKIVEIEWGADTERFLPGARTRQTGEAIAVFAGAFRAWHGAIGLVRAVETLQRRGRTDIKAVLIGDGPEWPAVRDAARHVPGVTLTGAVPHDEMPRRLAAADIGVAPFDAAVHPPLALEFYWSPLKIFEYMACGLPVVAPAIPRLRQLVADGREGILYDGTAPDALANALDRFADPALRRTMGAAARERAVKDFSWNAHCARLDEVFRTLAAE